MIIWDFSALIALSLSIGLALVIGVWVFYTLNRGVRTMDKEEPYLKQCLYCAYLFLDYQQKKQVRCPHCGSYLEF